MNPFILAAVIAVLIVSAASVGYGACDLVIAAVPSTSQREQP